MQHLAQILDSRRAALLDAWATAVDQARMPAQGTTSELGELMPTFLGTLIACGDAPEPAVDVEPRSSAALLREGFELEAVVREYGLLLRTALDFVERAGTAVPIGEVRDLVDRVGVAVAEAIAEHTRRQGLATRAAWSHGGAQRSELFEHVPAIIGHVAGPDHVFSFANRRFMQLVGGRRLTGLPFIVAMPELADQAFVDLLDAVYATGKPYVAHAMPASLDRTGAGEVRQGMFDFVYQPTRDAAGAVDGIFIHASDVTETVQRDRRLADVDESLAAAEEQRNELSMLLRQAPVAITLFHGPKHIIEMANPGVCRLWGRTEDQVLGRPLFEALPEAAGQGFEALLAEVLATGTPFVGKELVARLARAADGTMEDVHMDFVYQPMLDGTGKVDRILVVANEVTERVHARKALEEARLEAETQRAKLHELFMQVPALVAVFRGPLQVCELVNPAYQRAIGGRAILGLPIREALPELTGQGFFELLDGVYATGVPFVGTEVLAHVDRSGSGHTEPAYFDFVYQPLRDPVDALDGVLVFGVDVTEQVLARQAIEETARERQTLLDDARAARALAEHASQAMDEFLATVSHELRTPLTSMLGWTRLLRNGQVVEAQRPKVLETIERNARVQAQLIEDLLDVSRIISGKMRLDVSDVDVRGVVEAALEVVQPAADAKGIRLVALLDSDVIHVTGDGSRLQQVAWNLLSNAVKFTPQGGHVELRLTSTESFVELVVTDTGQGIDAAFLDHAFDRFRQADAASTRTHGGLGLGLSIVKNIVELHGGNVRASSEGIGRGASFFVQLPLLAKESPASIRQVPSERPSSRRLATDSAAKLSGMRVLIVEDETDARELLVTLLERCGAVVSAVASAAEAVAAVERERPAVVVSDIGMPGEDGYALIRRVRALEPVEIARTPVVALTAFARPEDRARALSAGFDDHVSKPIEPAALFAAVARAAVRG